MVALSQSQSDLFSITGSETMTRTISLTEGGSGQSFQVTYNAVGASGAWGASILDNVVGGCKFPDGSTELRTVMLSSDGNSKTITVDSSSSDGSCSFSGDYQFGVSPIGNFQDLIVEINSCNTESDTDCDGVYPEVN